MPTVNYRSGFTMLEVMLSVAVIAILAGATLPLWTGLLWRTDLAVASDAYIAAVHEAQVYARGMRQDSGWGVHVEPGAVVVYAGSGYNNRNQAYDRVVPLPQSVEIAGNTEVYFAPHTATTDDAGTIDFLSPNGATSSVRINKYGAIFKE